MNKYKFGLVLVAMLFFTFSCTDEDLAPIVTFDSAIKGAYPRLISETGGTINLFEPGNSAYTYTVEFVDLEQGNLVSEYNVTMTYEDNDDSNGDNSTGPISVLTLSQSDFTTNAAGFRESPAITFTAADAFAAAGVSAADVSTGDNFDFTASVTLTDGSIFGASNSSATVRNSGGFRGHFGFTMNAICPSDLGGTYSYVTTNIWCTDNDPPAELTGTVDIEEGSNGEYVFSDWSFGTYRMACYSATTSLASGLEFTEACTEVSFTDTRDADRNDWTFDTSIDGEEWTINWSNTFGESATTVITFPGGVPFTLKQ
ncbi:MAG: hypothetical protein Sapg2KO_18870 [Saprospiraceae bacterium]